MDDARLERLLRGYRLPEPAADADRRIVFDGQRALARARTRSAWGDAVRIGLERLGFGPVALLVDLAGATDTEYRVVVI